MAQVTMSSQEYLELVEKVRRLDQLEKDMLDAVEIELTLDSSYQKFRLNTQFVMSKKVEHQVIRKIVDAIKDVDAVMDDLIADNRHFLDLSRGVITYSWDEHPDKGEIDLFTDKAFKEAWDKRTMKGKEDEVSEE
ncbi:MAG: hypothetical protein ACOX8G_10930 [Eubacterium sp.]|jgi:hypothetical protein